MTQFCHLNATDFILGGTGRESFLVVFLKLHRATLEKERGGGWFISCVSTDNGVPTQAGTIPKMIITHAYQIAEHLIWDF